MLDSLIIILREVLEAAILISVLLASLQMTRLKNSWLIWSIFVGLICAAVLANQFATLSNALDGVGQEISNAIMLFTLASLLPCYLYFLCRYHSTRFNYDPLMKLILLLIITIAVMREGVEIIIYIYGYITNKSESLPLFIGASLGAWIGISIGIIVYYSILQCSSKYQLVVIFLLATIVGAGMISEGFLYLIQADWVESGRPLWDSSSFVSEASIMGQLLYATFAYEATPAGIQVFGYLSTVLVNLLLAIYIRGLNNKVEKIQ